MFSRETRATVSSSGSDYSRRLREYSSTRIRGSSRLLFVYTSPLILSCFSSFCVFAFTFPTSLEAVLAPVLCCFTRKVGMQVLRSKEQQELNDNWCKRSLRVSFRHAVKRLCCIWSLQYFRLFNRNMSITHTVYMLRKEGEIKSELRCFGNILLQRTREKTTWKTLST